MIWTVTVSSTGQLTIPKPAREAPGLQPGTVALLTLHEGKAELAPILGDIDRWFGALKDASPTASLEQVRTAVRRAIAEQVVRETGSA